MQVRTIHSEDDVRLYQHLVAGSNEVDCQVDRQPEDPSRAARQHQFPHGVCNVRIRGYDTGFGCRQLLPGSALGHCWHRSHVTVSMVQNDLDSYQAKYKEHGPCCYWGDY